MITTAALKTRLPKAHAGARAHGKIRHADLELEGARLPADVSRRDVREEEMKDGRPEARHPNGQEQNPGEQTLGDWSAGSAQPCERKRRDEQEDRQVAQDEGDRFGHHGLLTRMSGGLDSGRAAR
jgi:hypothetical protein